MFLAAAYFLCLGVLQFKTMNIILLNLFCYFEMPDLKYAYNVTFFDDQYLQASLPEKSGRLGICVSSIASPAFLPSAVGTRNLQNQILCTDVIRLNSAIDICQTMWLACYIRSIIPCSRLLY